MTNHSNNRLDYIKNAEEYASRGVPPHGKDDLWWLIGEVDRLRAQVESQSTYARYRPLSLPELVLARPTDAIEICERLADEMDERERHADADQLRDVIDAIAAVTQAEAAVAAAEVVR